MHLIIAIVVAPVIFRWVGPPRQAVVAASEQRRLSRVWRNVGEWH